MSEVDLSKARSQGPLFAKSGDVLPPHAQEAEDAALGCIILDASKSFDDIMEKIGGDPSVFFDLRNRKIFEVLLKMYEAGVPIDSITVHRALEDAGILKDVGGDQRIAALQDSSPSAANAAYYASTIRDKALLRKTIQLCHSTVSTAMVGPPSVDSMLDEFEAKAFKLRDHGTAQVITVKDVAKQSITRLEERSANRGKLGGLPSGLIDLDALTDGFRGGELIVIAARPSGGKTQMGLNILDTICVENKHPAAIFSLEMTSRALYDRLICSRGRVDASRYRRGDLTEDDARKVLVAHGAISKSPLTFIEADGMTISGVQRVARRLHRQGLLQFAVIDYLQLIRATRSQEKKTYEIGEVSTGLKHLAKELNIPILALAQLNRRVDDMGKTRRPRTSDIRDSGQIEQDADMVGLLHTEDRQPNPDEFFLVTLIIGKQREGATDDVNLVFRRKITRFENATRYNPER